MRIFSILGQDYDSNVYVIPGEKPTVIDTGTGLLSEYILKAIQQHVDPADVQQIILTHEHYDHVGGVMDILAATQHTAKVLAHKDIVSKLKEGKSSFAEMLGGSIPKITVDVALSDGAGLTVGDESCTVLFTPGHSIGSLCVYSAASHVLFSGDTVFSHGGFGRYDFPGGNVSALVKSIERLSSLEVTALYPGHGPVVEHKGSEHVAHALRNIRSMV